MTILGSDLFVSVSLVAVVVIFVVAVVDVADVDVATLFLSLLWRVFFVRKVVQVIPKAIKIRMKKLRRFLSEKNNNLITKLSSLFRGFNLHRICLI